MTLVAKSDQNGSGTRSLPDRIADTLERDPGLSYRQVAKAYDVDVATVYRAAARRPGVLAIRRGRQFAGKASGDWVLARGGEG
ncbi:MAG: hypothetical protein R3F35_01615 [Myxococcota bacterium]